MDSKRVAILSVAALALVLLTLFPPFLRMVQIAVPAAGGETDASKRATLVVEYVDRHHWIGEAHTRPTEERQQIWFERNWSLLIAEYALVLAVAAVLLSLARDRSKSV